MKRQRVEMKVRLFHADHDYLHRVARTNGLTMNKTLGLLLQTMRDSGYQNVVEALAALKERKTGGML